MIDFDKLDRADIEVVNSKLTASDRAEISKFLKDYKAKEARKKSNPNPFRKGKQKKSV